MTTRQDHRPVGRATKVGIDVSDLEAGARFWGEVLGLTANAPRGPYVSLGELMGGFGVYLQRVPEGKIVKNRVHLDLEVDDLDASVARVIELGGSLVTDVEDGSYRFSVVADPDGNEFCLLP